MQEPAMTGWQKLTRTQIAELVARDIPDGAYVNLGIGMPTTIAQHLPKDREIILHSENGIVGMTNVPQDGRHDPDIINAGKEFMGLLPGASITEHVTSFAMMRGGHLDLTVLGAFQVSRMGDLANWDTGDPNSIPAVGGAMDLAAGAKQFFVMMEHVYKNGAAKIVTECTYPLTGARGGSHLHRSCDHRCARRRAARRARDGRGYDVGRIAGDDRRAADRNGRVRQDRGVITTASS
jgi:3-oxoadipate CoA-transferase beta subunit